MVAVAVVVVIVASSTEHSRGCAGNLSPFQHVRG